MLFNTRPVSIEWGMCDAAGIVFFPRYFEVFDNAVHALFKSVTGLTKYQMLSHYGFAGYPCVEFRSKFLKPCRFGDEVKVETSIVAMRRSSFDIEHRLLRDDGSLAVEGWDTRVWVGRDPANPDALKSQPLPADIVAAFNQGQPRSVS